MSDVVVDGKDGGCATSGEEDMADTIDCETSEISREALF
jgi:hypothetical protein